MKMIKEDEKILGRIREVHYRDIDTIGRIYRETFPREFRIAGINIDQEIEQIKAFYPLMRILSLFPNRYQHFFNIYVYEREGQVLGCVSVNSARDNKRHWCIHSFAVDERFRGRGIGSSLLKYVIELYGRLGTKTFLLEVRDNNPAIRLYKRLGFEIVTHFKIMEWRNPRLEERIIAPSIKGFRPRHYGDWRGIFELYQAETPENLRRIQAKRTNCYHNSIFKSIFSSLAHLFTQLNDIEYVVDCEGKIIAYLSLEYRSKYYEIKAMLHPDYPSLTKPLIMKVKSLLYSWFARRALIEVMDYQEELGNELLEEGFSICDGLYLMAKIVKEPRDRLFISSEGEDSRIG